MAGETVFVNFTNHPSDKWSREQFAAATQYGRVVDLPFPQVDPAATEEDVKKLADEYVKKILALRPTAVLCQGEFTLCYNVITMLKEQGVPAFAACSRRIVEEEGDTRVAKFVFEGLRAY